MDAMHEKIDGFKMVLQPTYAEGANLLLIGVTLS
jgi:hypothetical protein